MVDGWVLADVDGGGRILVHTTDAGANWKATSAPDVTGAVQVLFADPGNGWIVGDGGLQSTHDGGATWAAAKVAGGIATGAAVASSAGTVDVAYVRSGGTGVSIASSPIDHDAFVRAPVNLPFGAGPRLDVTMSAGGPYGELIYNDRTFIGAAEIRNGQWDKWDLTCPYPNATAVAGLSPQGEALAIACSPSGFGDNAPVVGANLSTGTVSWTTIEPAGDANQDQTMVDLATAMDNGARIVCLTTGDGSAEIATSTDGGATWPARTPFPSGRGPTAIAHLPNASVLLSMGTGGGFISADGLTWTSVGTGPVSGQP